MGAARYLRLFRGTHREIDEIAAAWAELAPASMRIAREVAGEATDKCLRGYDTVKKHREWVGAMVQRLEQSGLSQKNAVLELQELMRAIHRIPGLEGQRAADVLDHLRKTASLEELTRLRAIMESLIGSGGQRKESNEFVRWLMHKQFGDVEAGRLELAALIRHIPGFGGQADPAALRLFKEAYDKARQRVSSGKQGEAFEKWVTKLGDFALHQDLNKINSKGSKMAGEASGSVIWRFNGRDYTGGAGGKGNFDFFDAILKKGDSVIFGSIGDGGFPYLTKKFDDLIAPSGTRLRDFERIVEELMFLARKGDPALSALAQASQTAAARYVVKRTALVVHPDSVDPLRAIIASRPGFQEVVAKFARDTDAQTRSADDLLAVIQPAFS